MTAARWVLQPIRPLTVIAASVRRDWKQARSYRFALVLNAFQVLAAVASYFFLGRLVGRGVATSAKSQLNEGYFAFAMIGTTMLSLVANSLTTFARRLRTDQTSGTLEALLISPSPSWLVIPASASFELVFGAMTSILTVGLAAAVFGLRFDVTATSGVTSLLAFSGALVLFCAIGIAFSGLILVVKRGEGAIGLVVSAFSLFGGVLYPIQLLPTALRYVADILPFTWVLEILRGGLLDRSAQWQRLGELWFAAVLLIPVALWIFTSSLRHARRTGSLAQY